MTAKGIDSRKVLKKDLQDPEFQDYWVHTSLARAVAIAVIRYRAEHGLSQRGLAQLLGIPQPHVFRLELGERHPTPETLARLTRALGLHFSFEVGPAEGPARTTVEECDEGETMVANGLPECASPR